MPKLIELQSDVETPVDDVLDIDDLLENAEHLDSVEFNTKVEDVDVVSEVPDNLESANPGRWNKTETHEFQVEAARQAVHDTYTEQDTEKEPIVIDINIEETKPTFEKDSTTIDVEVMPDIPNKKNKSEKEPITIDVDVEEIKSKKVSFSTVGQSPQFSVGTIDLGSVNEVSALGIPESDSFFSKFFRSAFSIFKKVSYIAGVSTFGLFDFIFGSIFGTQVEKNKK